MADAPRSPFTVWGLSATRMALALMVSGTISSRSAHAYPTSIAFVPSADVLEFGKVRVDGYAIARVSPSPIEVSAAAGAVTIGVSPGVPLSPGLEPLKLEVGFDALRTSDGSWLPLASAKVTLTSERGFLPALALGVLSVSLDSWPGLALEYLVAGKTLRAGSASLGRLTLGLVHSGARPAERPPACIERNACAFRGSWPFSDRGSWAPLAGYELPLTGALYVAVDHFGGTSALGTTNVIVAYSWSSLSASVGAWLTHDRRREILGHEPWDGVFAGLSYTVSLHSTHARP